MGIEYTFRLQIISLPHRSLYIFEDIFYHSENSGCSLLSVEIQGGHWHNISELQVGHGSSKLQIIGSTPGKSYAGVYSCSSMACGDLQAASFHSSVPTPIMVIIQPWSHPIVQGPAEKPKLNDCYPVTVSLFESRVKVLLIFITQI